MVLRFQLRWSVKSRIKEWQNRPLKPVYPFVFMDAIRYNVREDGRIKSKAAYVVLGIDLDGFRDILGIWIRESESSKFWLGVLNELKNRGSDDVLIFSVDGLTGLKEAIGAAYPKAEIQRCVICKEHFSIIEIIAKFIGLYEYKPTTLATIKSNSVIISQLN